MSNAQVTQVAVEDVVQNTPQAQVTQVAVEDVVQGASQAQVTQCALEVVTLQGKVGPFVFVAG